MNLRKDQLVYTARQMKNNITNPILIIFTNSVEYI